MKIVCISDTHCQLNKVNIPDGDILIHSGDLTFKGDVSETSKELFELSKHRARFKHIILVEGNHDWLGARNPSFMDQMCLDNGITLLKDSGIAIDGMNFWGSPWQPEFFDWAYNLPRGEALKEKWALIPDNTNVLITHGPPMGILDTVQSFQRNQHVGCQDLYDRVQELKDLKLHIFGHIHLDHGCRKIGNVTFVNASTCTEKYKPTNQPIIVNI